MLKKKSGYHRLLAVLMAIVMILTVVPINSYRYVQAQTSDEDQGISKYLLAQYDFEDTQDLGKDSTENKNSATVFGAVSSVNDGIRGKVARFDSSNHGNSDAYMEMPKEIVKQKTFTIMTWAKYDMNTVGNFARIFAIETPGRLAFHTMAKCANSWGGYRTELLRAGLPTVTLVGSDLTYGSELDGWWHHIAISYNGTSLQFFVNGELAIEQNVTVDLSAIDVTKAYIGKTGNYGDGSYNGYLDDFRVYSKALNKDEIIEASSMCAKDFLRAKYDFEDMQNLGKDTSGNDKHGTAYNQLVSVEGIRGLAVKFNTTTKDYIEIPVSTVKGEEITISSWVKRDQDAINGFVSMFSAEANSGGNNLVLLSKSGRRWNGYEAYMQLNGITFMPDVTNRVNAYRNMPAVGNVLAKEDVWQHITLTVKGNAMKLYVNGELAAEKTSHCKLSQLNPLHAYIGATMMYADPSFNGCMDDFRVYGKALTAEEIAQENVYEPEDFLFTHYSFDDSGNLTKDTSGYDYDAVVGDESTGTFESTEGIVGDAGYLDGNTYLQLPENILVGSQGLTITSWVKVSELPPAYSHLFHFDYWPATDNSIWISFDGNAEGLAAGSMLDDYSNVRIASSSSRVAVNEWAHIAYTLNDDAVTLYLNGKKIAESTEWGMDASDLYTTSHNFIGRAYWWDPLLKASIDEFKMYDKVLSIEEIVAESEGKIKLSGLNSIYVDGVEIDEFSTTTYEYYKVLPKGTTEVPEVTAKAPIKSMKISVTPAEKLPGITTISVENTDGTNSVYTVEFSVLSTEVDDLKHPELDDIQIDDKFWSPKLETFASTTAEYVLRQWEEETHSSLVNFDKVAAGNRNTQDYIGGMTWGECDFYASIAGASRLLKEYPNSELEALLEGQIDRIYAASESVADGYFSIYNLLMTDGLVYDEANQVKSMDLLNMGYLLESGIAYYEATGNAKLLRVGIRFLNHAVNYIDHGNVNLISFHPGPEYSIIAFYEYLLEHPEVKNEPLLNGIVKSEEDYKEFVYYLLINRGNHTDPVRANNYGSYASDHMSYKDQTTAAGHSVMANLYYFGLAQYGRISGDLSFTNSANRLWENIVNRQMYITGGTGSVHGSEGYGGDYQLPHNGYCESCASGALAQLSDSLSMSLAEAKYQDIVELQLYNNLLGSIGENGTTFFYQNPLTSALSSRWSWHGVACCTKYGLMIYGDLPRYVYAYDETNIYANQYIGSNATLHLASGDVVIKQESDWVWNGTSTITVEAGAENLKGLYLRLPEWSSTSVVKVNGQPVQVEIQNNYAVLNRTWTDGDKVEICADMTPTRVYSSPNVVYDDGYVALKRGPLVYCLEGIDNKFEEREVTPYISLPKSSKLSEKENKSLYGGVVTIKADAKVHLGDEVKDIILTAIPFYARSNRGASSIDVWIAEDNSVIPEMPESVVGGNIYIDFEEQEDGERFDFYSTSASASFKVSDGILKASNNGELKAILKNTEELKDFEASVIIKSGKNINSGLYILASDPANQQDKITAYNIHLESKEGSSDLHVNVFKFDENGGYLGKVITTPISGYFQANMPKYDVPLRVVVKDGVLDVYLNNAISPAIRGIDVSDLSIGSVGLRSHFSDSGFDNLLVISPQISGTEFIPEDSEDSVLPEKPDDTLKEAVYTFESVWETLDFDFYHSSAGGFGYGDDKIFTDGEEGEFKAILRGNNRAYKSVSVDIYPDKDGKINSGIYVGASNAGHRVDRINALGILVQSNYSGWEDAPNRIDIIIGEFPTWLELDRFISETGNENALFTNGEKKPLNLKVDIDGNKVTVTLSLIEEPERYVQTIYKYKGDIDLENGLVGIRSMYDKGQYDNFSVKYIEKEALENNNDIVDKDDVDGNNANKGVNTGDNLKSGFYTIILLLSVCVIFIAFRRRRVK